jgi:hypothetical protein
MNGSMIRKAATITALGILPLAAVADLGIAGALIAFGPDALRPLADEIVGAVGSCGVVAYFATGVAWLVGASVEKPALKVVAELVESAGA